MAGINMWWITYRNRDNVTCLFTSRKDDIIEAITDFKNEIDYRIIRVTWIGS